MHQRGAFLGTDVLTRAWVDRAAIAATFLFVAVLQVHRLDDQDTWWHLATGRLIAERGSVPATDPFSFTAPGAPWINRQWLFDLGLYGLWGLGGDQATGLGAGALFFAAFACAYRLARRRLPAWAAAILVFLAAEAAVERFTVRPEAATFCLLAVQLLLLDGAVGWGTVAALVGVQVMWANLHALSALGSSPSAPHWRGHSPPPGFRCPRDGARPAAGREPRSVASPSRRQAPCWRKQRRRSGSPARCTSSGC